MNNTLYLDIFSGISGDMFLGALIDLGVEFSALERELCKLDVHGYHLHVRRQYRTNIEGVKFDVHLTDRGHEHEHEHEQADELGPHGHSHASRRHSRELHEQDHKHEQAHHSHGGNPHDHFDEHHHARHAHEGSRDYTQIKSLINTSPLSDWVKQKALAVFHRIAVAEGKIHGLPPEDVHFHEVGAIDSIVDIVGGCLALEMLGRPRVLAAPVVEGTGWVDCAHGRFPVPTAATLEILSERAIPITQCEEPHELVTPTGAALLAEFAESFGPMQSLVTRKIGYGLGTRENKTRPNVLRAILGEGPAANTAANDWETDTIAIIESNLDDSTAEILGHFVERALAAGALDAFHTPIQMKKNRPGILLTVLCPASEVDRYTEMMLRETSAFGVRRYTAERRKLQREFVTVKTRFGEVSVKLGKLNGRVLHAAPEFASCRTLAEASKVPLAAIYEAVQRALPDVCL